MQAVYAAHTSRQNVHQNSIVRPQTNLLELFSHFFKKGFLNNFFAQLGRAQIFIYFLYCLVRIFFTEKKKYRCLKVTNLYASCFKIYALAFDLH